MLPLVYHDDYSPPFPANHRFPMEKFRLLRDHLVDSGLVRDGELHEIKSPLILQPGPAALTDGVRELARIIEGWQARKAT